MARRGFFAELQHQAKLAAREQARAEREAVRQHNAALRQLERARKAEERANAQLKRAAEAERKRLDKEAREAHIETMLAQVEQCNRQLAEIYDEIDSLLAATLDVDDYVDLDSLRLIPKHPPFDRTDLEQPIPSPVAAPEPVKPELVTPDPPKGLGKLFGKGRYAKALAEAHSAHELAVGQWQAKISEHLTLQQAAAKKHALAEVERVAALERERSRYAAECKSREAEAVEHNKMIDELIDNLGYGTVEAVQEYVAIVLSNSAYPKHFPVQYEFSFDPATAELALRVLIPGPAELPVIKTYKYTKSSDEITTTPLSQKDCKDRYTGAIHQVALRSFHEIFEADRRGIVNTISLEVGAETTHPATGLRTYIPFVAAAAERQQFLEFELSAVVPASTLAHLGAAVSKNPFGLVPVETSGIRKS